ncbi:Fucose-specific lectin [Glarea lozoyensis ATCC 20868]|uniref:Fucose-specific lectin n=1 Tax=Glarea lozoyensis (strain ATCC 20868 / MF5171) TaxID=1116229 RepID=S3EAI2_GLAL2|nr:Fucose-specific lectin [Glarea lozoyensis ATCC 20868]EPE35308.1 Fucose-specific lectin [Glarea lozoyensis ATCC 20868]
MPTEVVNGDALATSNGHTGGPFQDRSVTKDGQTVEMEEIAANETGVPTKKRGKEPSMPPFSTTKDDERGTRLGQESREEPTTAEASRNNRFHHQQDSSSSAADGYYQTSRHNKRAPSMEERKRSEVSQFHSESQPSPFSERRSVLPRPADANHQRHQYMNGIGGLQVVPDIPPVAERRKFVPSDVLPPTRLWRLVVGAVFVALIAIIIALGVLVSRNKVAPACPPLNNSTGTETSGPIQIVPLVSNNPPGSVLSQTESIAATDVILGTFFAPNIDKPQTRVVFDGGNGKLCVRTKLGAAFIPQVKCIEGTNAKVSTPIQLVDWLGGPTIVYITSDNHLAGYNHVPNNDSWILSPLGSTNITVHPKSQLSSVTWLNGTSLWIYYQGTDGQLREWGLDDYRDISFREGSAGPLGAAVAGSFFGATRYVVGDSEFEEACYQATNGALHCRRYANAIWGSEVFTIAGTETGLALPASFDYTTVIDPVTRVSSLAVAYIKQNGFVTVQSRSTANGTDLGAFGPGIQVTQGDGSSTAGLVITGETGTVNIYLKRSPVSGGKIYQYSSNVSMTAWTQGSEFSA